MAEYDLISKTALLRHLDMAIDCKNCPRNADRKTYYDRCACSEVADICNTITDFATFVDVQPLSVVAEHIKNRLCETALNTDEAVARDAIADMAERVDLWIDELKDGDAE